MEADDWFPPFIIIPIWESKAEPPWLQTVAALKMPQKFEVSWDFPSLVSGARNSKLLFLPLPARKNQAVRRVVSKCSKYSLRCSVLTLDPSLQRIIYITYIYKELAGFLVFSCHGGFVLLLLLGHLFSRVLAAVGRMLCWNCWIKIWLKYQNF